MKATVLRCMLAVAMLCLPAAVHGADGATAPIVLKVGTVDAPGSPLGRALSALADRDSVNISQNDTLIGKSLQRNYPLRPNFNLRRSRIIMDHYRRCAGAVGYRDK